MATCLRALVMLSVLVGFPAAWIYYGPLPPEGQRVVDRVVAAAKEAIGWNKGAAFELTDSADVNYQPPAPAFMPPSVSGEVVQPSSFTSPPACAAPALVPAKRESFQEQVEPLLAQLRQFGVIEYALERWGDGGGLYRFRCEMPLGASADMTQQFEAVAADPQVSVEQVLAEVSQWQLKQRSVGM